MKKFLVTSLIAIAGQTSMAACLGEAQIIAQVQNFSKTLTSCVVQVSAHSITQYNSSRVCPLDLSEVLNQGIEVGLSGGHDCRLEIGETITGVLVKTPAGKIVLD